MVCIRNYSQCSSSYHVPYLCLRSISGAAHAQNFAGAAHVDPLKKAVVIMWWVVRCLGAILLRDASSLFSIGGVQLASSRRPELRYAHKRRPNWKRRKKITSNNRVYCVSLKARCLWLSRVMSKRESDVKCGSIWLCSYPWLYDCKELYN